jgi:glycine/D-amino acid oxidase-like deaminating enzyme
LNTSGKILVLGDPWSGPLFARALSDAGHVPELWISEAIGQHAVEAVYLGNGERREIAARVFGKSVSESLWALSEANYSLAERMLSKLGVPFEANGFSHDAGNALEEKEKGLCFSSQALARALTAPGNAPRRFHRVTRLESSRGLDSVVTLETAQGTVQQEAPMIVCVTEAIEHGAISPLSDKRIPISLTYAAIPRTRTSECSIGFYNDGAEYCFSAPAHTVLGSFRNLYLDRGVGLHQDPDPVTQAQLVPYFSSLGRIQSADSIAWGVRFESVSCDGLPLVGPLPGLPGVIFVTGFAARAACFLFAVAQDLSGVLLKAEASRLEVFSTRRLI